MERVNTKSSVIGTLSKLLKPGHVANILKQETGATLSATGGGATKTAALAADK